MKNKTILINPFDTLFFKDGKPFYKGQNSVMDSLILPYPSTVYGALFTELMYQNDDIKNWISTPRKNMNLLNFIKDIKEYEFKDYLRIKNIFLYEDEILEYLLFLPKDLEENSYKHIEMSKVIKENSIIASSNNQIFTVYLEESDKLSEAFVDNRSFKNNYLEQDTVNLNIKNKDKLINQYNKIGIQITTNTGTAEDKHLYKTNMIEFKENIKIAVEFEIRDRLEFEDKGILKLGGENKYCKYTSVNIESFDKRYEEQLEGENFKALVLSPMKIKGDLEEVFKGYEIINYAIDKIDKIGGFDYAAKKPKAMVNCIPTGSIIYLKNKSKKSIQQLNNYGEEIYKGFGKVIFIPIEGGFIDEI